MPRTAHTIHYRDHHHSAWDNAIPPALTVAPGARVEVTMLDASGGQITQASSPADLTTLSFDAINPVTGPIRVDGAEPGDALKVTLEAFRPAGWGWTGNIPGFGLLADQFPEPALKIWSYDAGARTPAAFGPDARVPLKPFCGTIGVAPAEPGSHSIVPPRNVGGNMDIRDLAAGVALYLPVAVSGALFSIGDGHACQGDGEVCGTAIETPMAATLTLELWKGAGLASPIYRTPGPVTRHLDAKGYDVTTGIGPDLMAAARDAVSRMIDQLCREEGLAPVDAYMLCSVCADLRIAEIVDQPNWVVSLSFPRIVFD